MNIHIIAGNEQLAVPLGSFVCEVQAAGDCIACCVLCGTAYLDPVELPFLKCPMAKVADGIRDESLAPVSGKEPIADFRPAVVIV